MTKKSVIHERKKKDEEEVKLEQEIVRLIEATTIPWQHAAPLHTTPASVLC